MKIVDAVWEQRNLGVTCYEITFDNRDSLDDIKARWDELTDRQYLVFKVPPKRADIVAYIQSRGFRFIEAVMTFNTDLKNFSVPEQFKPFCDQCTYAPMNDADIELMFTEIKGGIFKTDRVYLDPYFTHEQAAQRYVNWAKDMIERGAVPHKVIYQGETVGFFITQISPPTARQKTAICYLTGVYSDFEGTGMVFCVQYAETKFNMDNNVEISDNEVISGNNEIAWKVANINDSKLKSIQYVFIKHTDQQSDVRTKIIELLKDIRPESNNTPDSFDVVALVAALQKEFGISIKGRDITPEIFSTVDGITALLERYGVADEV